MATKKKPAVVYSWMHQRVAASPEKSADENLRIVMEWRVIWRIDGANGEPICSSNQGAQDKTDARRSVDALARVLCDANATTATVKDLVAMKMLREIGPGPKPGTPSPIKRTVKAKKS